MTAARAASPSATDRIRRELVLAAPRERVWRALTEVAQFNAWFGVRLTSPFEPGKAVSGGITFKGYEHVTLTIWIERMERDRYFAFRWHPYAVEPGVDYSAEPTTLVEFTLEDGSEPGTTRLAISESGFDAIPEARRATAFGMNSKGWEGQAGNIRRFVETGTATPDGSRVPHEP